MNADQPPEDGLISRLAKDLTPNLGEARLRLRTDGTWDAEILERMGAWVYAGDGKRRWSPSTGTGDVTTLHVLPSWGGKGKKWNQRVTFVEGTCTCTTHSEEEQREYGTDQLSDILRGIGGGRGATERTVFDYCSKLDRQETREHHWNSKKRGWTVRGVLEGKRVELESWTNRGWVEIEPVAPKGEETRGAAKVDASQDMWEFVTEDIAPSAGD